jgi:hypothetical protein
MISLLGQRRGLLLYALASLLTIGAAHDVDTLATLTTRSPDEVRRGLRTLRAEHDELGLRADAALQGLQVVALARSGPPPLPGMGKNPRAIATVGGIPPEPATVSGESPVIARPITPTDGEKSPNPHAHEDAHARSLVLQLIARLASYRGAPACEDFGPTERAALRERALRYGSEVVERWPAYLASPAFRRARSKVGMFCSLLDGACTDRELNESQALAEIEAEPNRATDAPKGRTQAAPLPAATQADAGEWVTEEQIEATLLEWHAAGWWSSTHDMVTQMLAKSLDANGGRLSRAELAALWKVAGRDLRTSAGRDLPAGCRRLTEIEAAA